MTTVILFIFLVLLAPTVYAAVRGAPLALTSKSRIKELIKIAEIKPGDKFYELGAGTGRVMVIAAKISGAEVFGFELSPIFYLISSINLRINKVKHKLFLKNLFSADLTKADVVFCFLMPKTLEKLRAKLKKELRPGAKIISYAFEIKNWQPWRVIKDNKKLPVYIYKI